MPQVHEDGTPVVDTRRKARCWAASVIPRQVFNQLAGCWTFKGKPRLFQTPEDDRLPMKCVHAGLSGYPNSHSGSTRGCCLPPAVRASAGPTSDRSQVGRVVRRPECVRHPAPACLFHSSRLKTIWSMKTASCMDLWVREAHGSSKYGSGTGTNFSPVARRRRNPCRAADVPPV